MMLNITIRKMNLKTIMRYHFTPIKMTIILKIQKVALTGEAGEASLHYWWECQIVRCISVVECKMGNNMVIPQKINTDLPYNPAILLVGMYTQKN